MYQKLLAPIDGSDEALEAAQHAVDLAADIGATVDVLYVMEAKPMYTAAGHSVQEDEQAIEQHREYAEERFTEVVDLATEKSVDCETAMESGMPAGTILEYADEIGADAIVMGACGHGWSDVPDAVLGSTTQRVNQNASIPVITVH